MKKIILPTDFSDNAQNAIDYALFLFEKEICTFYLLHAYHDAPSAPTTKFDIENDLKNLVKRTEAKNNNTNHHFEAILENDSLVNLMNRTVIDYAAHFVFMGTKGSSALRQIFLGSNTVDAIKHLVPCPIVAVPADYDYDLPDEIVFATDFKHAFANLELVPLISISKLWDSKISILHIHTEKELNDDQKENNELLKNGLKSVKSQFVEITMEDTISITLRNFEHEHPEIGMVALLNTKHGFFQKLLHEPVIKHMAFKTKVPLLVLPQIVA
ncbi:universal stress protein [Maribacter sp. ACAM166]|uniref:universal stress protein n=1 Tax=Maribacter sp. ACAM166 TaxID=2508996 RepID=UPI0010FDE6BE|nr:universal stress protein [Maribacter sp. ACAM166]TLP81771.1 universal stress protein [Maribacter sp. ACAM166]